MIALCIGRKEQGKTTLAYHLAYPFPTRIIFDPREHFFTSSTQIEEGSELYDHLDDKAEIIIKPADHYPEQFEIVCDQLRHWVRDNHEEEFALLIDEAYDIKTPEYMPASLDWLMRKTKRKQTRIIFTAHRPVDISTDIRALSDNWLIFQSTQEHDLRIIAERCGREVADEVQKLRPREFINWDDSIGTWTKFMDPRAWYMSLSRKETDDARTASAN